MDTERTPLLASLAAANAAERRRSIHALTPERAARELEGLLAMRGEFLAPSPHGGDDSVHSLDGASSPTVREAPIEFVPDAFRAIAACLEEMRVPYALIGGIAASLHGQPRYTSDVDLVIALPMHRLQEFARVARARGFAIDPERVRLQWLASGFGRIWYGEEETGIAVDLMSNRSDFLKSVIWRAEATCFAGVRTMLASAEDLILLKAMAWRGVDIGDAEWILIRRGPRIDRDYLRRLAARLAGSSQGLRELPARIDALLGDGPLPPPRRV